MWSNFESLDTIPIEMCKEFSLRGKVKLSKDKLKSQEAPTGHGSDSSSPKEIILLVPTLFGRKLTKILFAFFSDTSFSFFGRLP